MSGEDTSTQKWIWDAVRQSSEDAAFGSHQPDNVAGFIPAHDFVLIEKVEESNQLGAIFVPVNVALQNVLWGRVIARGHGLPGQQGWVHVAVPEGALVAFMKPRGSESYPDLFFEVTQEDGTKARKHYLLVRYREILGVKREPATAAPEVEKVGGT